MCDQDHLSTMPAMNRRSFGVLAGAGALAACTSMEGESAVGDLTQSVLRPGRLLDVASSGLQVVNETTNSAGQTVRRVRSGAGGLFEVVTDTAGRIVSSRSVGG